MKWILLMVLVGAHPLATVTPYNTAEECHAALDNLLAHMVEHETKWGGQMKAVCVDQAHGYSMGFE